MSSNPHKASGDIAVSVRGVSKSYSIAHNSVKHTMVGEAIMHRLKNPFAREEHETFWALKDVSFDILRGDVVGIIGRNGAGKSTLLKILSRITEPTAGQIDLYGRVGSLLEVGTGFHPELTGRENVYLNGAILGMRRPEITRHFDAIVAFAEVEKFLDTPVKRYSSGMYVRLAFAVAAHLNPEILVVDEVLAVGDAPFQKKCLGKMHDVAEKEGRTVLFVSHNMTAVQSLCNKAIWLQNGAVLEQGAADSVVPRYFNVGIGKMTDRCWDNMNDCPGNDKIRVQRMSVRPHGVNSGGVVTVHSPLVLEFDYWNFQPEAYLNLSLQVYNKNGINVFNTFPTHEADWYGKPFPRGLYRSRCYIPGDLLNDGTHRVELFVIENQGTLLFHLEDALVFDVEDSMEYRGAWHGEWAGASRPHLKWHTEMVTPSEQTPSQSGLSMLTA